MKTSSYVARVTNVSDPKKLGRFKVACAGILGDEDATLPYWIDPVLPAGFYLLPSVGDLVEIVVDDEHDLDESPSATSITNPRARWYGSILSDTRDGDFTSTRRRGFKSPSGHTIIFDDTPITGGVTLIASTPIGDVSIKLKASGGIDVDPGLLSAMEVGAGATPVAMNAQVLQTFVALGIGINGLGPGPVLGVDLIAMYTTFMAGLALVLMGSNTLKA